MLNTISQNFLPGLGVNLVLAVLAYLGKGVNLSGAIGGFFIGVVIFVFGGPRAFAVLVSFFAVGTAVTKLGYAKKAALGVAQENKGARGAMHAFAKSGAGAICSLLIWLPLSLDSWSQLCLLALVGSFATALSDTVGSEVGQLYGKHPFLITNFKPVPVGTEGAISVEGTAGGILASGLLAFEAHLIGMFPTRPLWLVVSAVVIGAFVGTTFESYLGAIFGKRNLLGNKTMNFLNTLTGAIATALAAVVFGHG